MIESPRAMTTENSSGRLRVQNTGQGAIHYAGLYEKTKYAQVMNVPCILLGFQNRTLLDVIHEDCPLSRG